MSRDDLEEHIREQLDEGIEVTAEDFEGRDCAHCTETIPFTEFPDGVVTWDVRVHEPDEAEPEPYYARYYFCSEECKLEAVQQPNHNADPDMIHEDDLDDERLITDGGKVADGHQHRFVICPDCGSDMQYPTQSDVICPDCDFEGSHVINEQPGETQHVLYRFTNDYERAGVVGSKVYSDS
jgi:Zn finger protein HypA/HybF involved in hydrogenase expression